MHITWKDVAAGALTALAVLVFVTTYEGWNVWLVGGSHRWAAGAITVIGGLTCGLGSPAKDAVSRVLAGFGMAAAVLAVVAVATGSLTPLSLLVLDLVVLWALSVAHHAGAFEQEGSHHVHNVS